jgi:hypothetical protein
MRYAPVAGCIVQPEPGRMPPCIYPAPGARPLGWPGLPEWTRPVFVPGRQRPQIWS